MRVWPWGTSSDVREPTSDLAKGGLGVRRLRPQPLAVMRTAPERSHFRIEQSDAPGRPVQFALLGELDIASADDLTEALTPLAEQRRAVFLDLSKLNFIDSSGLRAVIFAVARARREGWELEVGSQLTEPVRRVIELVGVGRHIWPSTE